jgi:glutamine amidotransferase
VGAFKDGMDNLKAAGLDEDIRVFRDTGRPFLGICLGMQMLMTVSDEFGIWDGLDLISGRVASIPKVGKNNEPLKIPHIGWNRIFPVTRDANDWPSGILENLEPGSMVYFVHSFHAVPMDRSHVLAVCDYNGVEVIAAVRKKNIFGCQFHPEKSGKTGLKIFKKFLEL